MTFNNEQLRVINHIDGPVLCIAGPGSGKTTSIIQRIVNMTNKDIDPHSILVVTFTKAAADDMKRKYQNKENSKNGVSFGTIHSFCLSVLRDYDNEKYGQGNILTDIEQREFIKTQIKPLHIEWGDQDSSINSIIGAISVVKNNGVNPNSVEVHGCSTKAFIAIYNAYERFKAENNKIDYDDMLFITNKLFENDYAVLNKWRNRYRYLIVDEFQDTNKLQAKILYTLARPKNNICIIGDDDQSIYAFRGAVPKIMLEFEKEFPLCEKIILNKNYRSEPEIVNSTRKLIEHNKTRFQKPLEATKQGTGNITHIVAKNRDKEIALIIKDLKAKQKAGISLSDTAILYRMNNQAPQLTQALIKANIPFYTCEPVYSNYEHWVFRDIKLFKKVADGACTIGEFLYVINRPNKFVSKSILPFTYSEKEVMKAPSKLPIEWQQKKMFNELSKWYESLHIMKSMKPSDFITAVRKDLRYDSFITTYSETNQLDKTQFFDILDEIQDEAEPFEDFTSWMKFVENELRIFKDKIKNKKEENSVVLSTMHRAKGLEWENVIIIDANEDITPYSKAETDEEMEEERRMFYVAATRAKTNLTVYSIERRNKTVMTASRFINEMLFEKTVRSRENQLHDATTMTKFRRGEWVFHKTFGIGMVTVVDSDNITIAFEKEGVKMLDKNWCINNLQLF